MFGFGLGKTFNVDTEIPDLSGKTILVTGGNIGLGRASCAAIAKHNPEHLYLAARSAEKAQAAIEQIRTVSPDVNVTFLECDLASLASVKKAAETFIAESKRLDILLCNAGVMALPPGLTENGYEIQFGTNHVGHALLLKLLLPTMLQTAERPGSDVRIIALSSMGHQWTTSEGIDFKNLKTTQKDYSTWALYGQSKLANILYAKALARKYPSIKVVAVHPGLVNTNLATSFLNGNVLYSGGFYAASWIPGVIQSPEQGSLNQLWAAFGKSDEVRTGEYYHPIAVAGSASKIATDEKLSDELYDWTQKELASY